MNKATLYLVIVEVRYSKPGFDSAERIWPVRIVAKNADSAQIGAMAWAEQQKAEGMMDGVEARAWIAMHTEPLGQVDCIAQSVIG